MQEYIKMNFAIGTVVEKVFSNDEISVMKIIVNGKKLRVVGHPSLIDLANTAEHYKFEGKYEDHYNYGTQFKVSKMHLIPVAQDLMCDFLVASNGIGKTIAKRLIDEFGSNLPTLLDKKEIGTIGQVKGVSFALALVICNAWKEQQGKTELIKFMELILANINSRYSVTLKNAAKKAFEFYKLETVSKLQEDPYRLWAFSTFKASDQLAKAMCIDDKDPRRLRCAVEEVLYLEYEAGSTAVTPKACEKGLMSLVGTECVITAIYEANKINNTQAPRIIVRDNGNWSLPGITLMENFVQEQLEQRIRSIIQQLEVKDEQISNYLLPDGNALNKAQIKAVKTILSNPICCISGEAGTGKTSVLVSVNDLIKQAGLTVMQVALAGKAAQRLIQQTNEEAYTITNLLSKIKTEPRFLDNHPMPVLHIDEASMVDLITMYRVLKAFEGKPIRLVLIGDEAQLPPIGAGLIFHKLVTSKKVPVVTLDINYRQKSGNGISICAKQIRHGLAFEENKDVMLIECEDDLLIHTIEQQYLKYKNSDVHVIAARKATVAKCNKALHISLLSDAPIIMKAPEFRVGDSVIYKQNNQKLKLVNGSVGSVVAVTVNDTVEVFEDGLQVIISADLVVEFRNEGRVPLMIEDIKNTNKGDYYLHHAYAITCHAAQGSEFDVAIIPLEQSRLVERSWLYTATTRAKKKVVFIGTHERIKNIIDKGYASDQRTVGIEL